MTIQPIIRLFTVVFALWLPIAASAVPLQVKITQIKPGKGTLYLYVFTSAEGFPKEEHAATHHSLPVPNSTETSATIEVPEAKEYAIMAFQDLNGDGKMERFMGMIPREPYALSRNPSVMGKPKFADSVFSRQDGAVIELELR